jgi:hypothetical protein
MASGQKARRNDLKTEATKRSGIEDTARSQVNTFLGGSNGLGAVNDQNRNIYLGLLGNTMQPGAAGSGINSSLGGYFGTPAQGQTSTPSFQVPQPSQTPTPAAPRFFRYSDDNQSVYRSDGSHVADPETFFREGGNRDWSGIDTIDRPANGVLPWNAAPQATPPDINVAEPAAPKSTPQTGGDLSAPTPYNLSGEREGMLSSYFNPSSPTFGQTPGAYLPTGQLAKRRQLREATNRGATTWARNNMNENLRGLADEEADRESAQDEALSVSGARAGYDANMRGALTDYDEARRAERERAADRDQQRNLAALGITSGMASGSQNLYGGLLSNNLNAATGAYQNAYDAYDQARAQQGQGWWQLGSGLLGLGGAALGGYLARPAARP